jgi:hypothetical protein
MKITRLFPVAVLAILASLTLGCGSSKVPTQKVPPQAPDVYVAGFEINDSDLHIAKYWKNGAPVVLGAGTDGSWANSIVVSGGDVYAAGTEGSADGDVAKYWINGVAVTLSAPGVPSEACTVLSIFVDGNDVYAAGVCQGVGQYWKNGVSVALTDAANYGEAWSIAESDGDVYVAGWQYVTTQIDSTHTYTAPVAMLWKNGVRTELSDPLAFGVGFSMFLLGSDIYVAGNTCQENQSPPCSVATYWKNGTPVVLTTQTDTNATSVFASGSDVYVAGNYTYGIGSNNIGDLWTNGTLTQLTTVPSAANQVVVSGSDVYIAGASTVAGNETAGYFKNGFFTPVTDGTHFASGYAMTVVSQTPAAPDALRPQNQQKHYPPAPDSSTIHKSAARAVAAPPASTSIFTSPASSQREAQSSHQGEVLCQAKSFSTSTIKQMPCALRSQPVP